MTRIGVAESRVCGARLVELLPVIVDHLEYLAQKAIPAARAKKAWAAAAGSDAARPGKQGGSDEQQRA